MTEGQGGAPLTKEVALEPLLCGALIDRYEGESNDLRQPEGQGTAWFRGGHKYSGAFLAGELHGTGKYEWVDGIIYEGTFQRNKIQGTGVFTWPKELATYEGEVKDGKKHGFGRLKFDNSPAIYEGQWEHGYRHGEGKLIFNEEQTCYYQGHWNRGKKDGFGRMQYPSGNYYEGQWQQDVKMGLGTMHWIDSNQTYEGRWEYGYPDGQGEQTWLGGAHTQNATTPNTVENDTSQYQLCNRYKGTFKKGNREGLGSFFYSTGAQYTGQWSNNVKHGEGAFTFEDGSVYEGAFLADKPCRPGQEGDADNAKPKARASPLAPPVHPVRLEIRDLLSEELVPEESLVIVNNVVLRFNSELKAVYRHYAMLQNPDAVSGAGAKTFMLKMHQFWRLMYDCRVCSKDFTIANINVIVKKALREPEGKHTEVHHPDSMLLFREFAECLVRVSHHLFHDLPALERRLHHLINLHILPYAGKVEANSFKMEMNGEDVQAVIAEHSVALQRLFNVAAQTVTHRDCIYTDAISLQEVLVFLKKVGAFGPYLSPMAVVSMYCRANFPEDPYWIETKGGDKKQVEPIDDDADDDYLALDSMMIYPEFIELIARCAARYRQKQVENNHKSPSGHDTLGYFLETFLWDTLFHYGYNYDILDDTYAERPLMEDDEGEENSSNDGSEGYSDELDDEGALGDDDKFPDCPPEESLRTAAPEVDGQEAPVGPGDADADTVEQTTEATVDVAPADQ